MNVNFVLSLDKDGRTDSQNVSLFLKKSSVSFWHAICLKIGVMLRHPEK